MTKETFYNVEYEKCLLAIMLLDNSLIDIISGKLTSGQFYDVRNGNIFNAICTTFTENKHADILNVSEKFSKEYSVYISSLTDLVATASNWEFYANEIKDFWLARKLKIDLQNTINSLNKDSVIDCIHNLDSSLTSYMKFDNGHPHDMRSLCQELTVDITKNFNSPSRYLGIDIGWENLNDIIDGLQYEKLVIIGARPSVGKTAFAIQMASNITKQGIPVCFFSLEMRAKVLFTRMVSQDCAIPISFIQHGLVTQSQSTLQKLNNSMTKIFSYPLNIYDDGIKSEKELLSRIRVEAKQNKVKVFFIDHIGLVRHSDRTMKRVEQLDEITEMLARAAKELGVTIVCLSQLRRDAEGKEPNLADLRDSGAIEQNADICMFLHRNRATGGEMSIPSKVIVIKHRDGACGTANMLFIPNSTKFVIDNRNDFQKGEK